MSDVVELTLSRPVNVTDTSFVRASLQERMRNGRLSRHPTERVQFNVLIHCTSGKGHHTVDFVDFDMTPGTAIWVRPGQVQRWADEDTFEAYVVVFDSALVPDLPLFDRAIGSTCAVQLGSDAEPLRQQFDFMAADLALGNDDAIAAAVVGVMLRLVARHAEPKAATSTSPRQQLASAFLASVESNVGERSVSWHAHQVGASVRSVARATVEVLGDSPKKVIDACTILEARRLLAWSDDDITAIARSLDFVDASSFTRYFRRQTGLSPSAFREMSAAL